MEESPKSPAAILPQVGLSSDYSYEEDYLLNSADLDLDDILSHPAPVYQPLAFDNYIDFALYFHDALIATGGNKLHPWQVEEGMRISNREYTKEDPLLYLLVAANGSGKDAYCIALMAVWFAACNIRSRVVITSASHSQLSSQSEAYIRNLASAVNAKLGGKFFLIKKQHLVCTLTGSEIKLFATDDPGKAEGYHPFPDKPDGKLCIIVNEAKTVSDEIYAALCRCTCTHFILVSSPGQTSGFFYANAKGACQYPTTRLPGQWYMRRITAFDCPHIPLARIQRIKNEYGENSPYYRSSILADFTSVDQSVVIQAELVKSRLLLPPDHGLVLKREVEVLRAGADFAAGNDECATYVIKNDKVIGSLKFRLKNNVTAAKHLVDFWDSFKSMGLQPTHVFGDDGGIGRVVIDILSASGWPINRVLNQSAPIWRLEYGNRGAELWFMLSKLIEANLLVLPADDTILHTQLANRYYRQGKVNGKLVLESKAEARLHGHGSPDRADAYCLAYTGVTPEDFLGFSYENVATPISTAPASQTPAQLMEEYRKEYRSQHTFGRLHGKVLPTASLTGRQILSRPALHSLVQSTRNPLDLIIDV